MPRDTRKPYFSDSSICTANITVATRANMPKKGNLVEFNMIFIK